MRVKKCIALNIVLGSLALVPSICADTYSTFQTTRYYSTNRRYFVEVTESKRATLYRNGRRLRRVWSRTLSEFPRELLVTEDGKRVVIVDRYYGNGGSPETPVLVILDESGEQIVSHRLGDVATLNKVMHTASSAHWFRRAHLSSDGQFLMVETHITKHDWAECNRRTPVEEWERCWETIPYQQLRFALGTGELIERISIALR